MADVNVMNRRIEIQQKGETKNEVGELINSWITYKKLWAEKREPKVVVTNGDTKEVREYGLKFVVRYRQDLNESMRVIYNNIVYDIVSIQHDDSIDKYETLIEVKQYQEGVYNE